MYGWEMLLKQKKNHVERKALDFLFEYPFFINDSLNLGRVIQEMGFDLQTFSKDVSGYEDIKGEMVHNAFERHIALNDSLPLAERRFTAAHEIAHFFLHSDSFGNSYASRQKFTKKKKKTPRRDTPEYKKYVDELIRKGLYDITMCEQEADYFAACILMPELLVRKHIASCKLRGEDLEKYLANVFKVSQDCAKLRLQELEEVA